MIGRWIAVAVLAVGLVGGGCAGKEKWQRAQGPLETKWAKDVSPKNVHKEYPRPQMVREEWENLNGLWQYAITPKDATTPQTYQGEILVPFAIESALSGVMKRVSENERLWYRRTFEVPKGWKGQRLLLHFGAVDWDTTVFVNGKQVGTHRGGYDGFTFDVTDALKAEGEQELIVSVWDPTDAGTQARGKQVRKPEGIWYTPTTGIWQTVWIEPVNKTYIKSVRVTPDVDKQQVVVEPMVAGATNAKVKVVVRDGGRKVAEASGNGAMTLKVANPRLWSPDSPHLYDLRVTLDDASGKDEIESYFGMRKIALGKDEKGITRIMLNNQFVFQVGFLDQGFWPDGLYTAPTDEALRYDIEISKELGMNMARKHVKVEPARWYYWCDKLGMLVWQDMPSGNFGKGATKEKEGVPTTEEAGKQYMQELQAMIDGLWNHPSIVMWVVFNEGWGQHETARVAEFTKQHDPSRLVNGASGWHDRPGVGDVHDAHIYPGPTERDFERLKPEEKRASVLGEFGGLGLPLEGHTWQSKANWGYRNMSNPDRLTEGYVKLMKKCYELKDNPGISAVVYTQTTDVEIEVNGLLTYDRAVLKADLKKVAAANQGKPVPGPQTVELAPTSQLERVMWRYTMQQPAENWFQPGFDASGWKEGQGGFGTRNTPGASVRTEWNTPAIWIRREFEVPAGKLSDVRLMLHHDEDAEVYINGVLAAKVTGYTSEYEEIEVSKEAKATMKPGKNVLAIHCRQTGGGQYIDAGILAVKE